MYLDGNGLSGDELNPSHTTLALYKVELP